MMNLSTILFLATFLTVVNCHFLLFYPPTRGFDEDKEPNFCGGFPLSTNRSQFPLNGGMVSIQSEHPTADVDVLISFDSNPTTFSNFNTTSSGTPIPFLVNFTVMHAQGDACFPVNVSALGLPDAHDGANATILVQFNGGDGQLFQCADVILSSNATVPSGTTCQNATGAFPSSTAPASTGTGSPSSSHSSSAVILTAGATGFAGVVLGAFMLLL